MEYVPPFTNQSRVPHGKLGLAMTALFIFGLGLIASSSVDWFLQPATARLFDVRTQPASRASRIWRVRSS
jgi:hypothetical protein